jgi:uncharacterized protein (TIGR00369 family)
MPTADALGTRLASIPIFETLGLRLGLTGEGTATLTAPNDPAYNGIFKSFHGGLLMTLADTAACLAVLTLAGADAAVTTTDMNIRFLAACRSDATAEARILKFGKTLCPVSVEIRDAFVPLHVSLCTNPIFLQRVKLAYPETTEGRNCKDDRNDRVRP